jgi:hypothetical protein
MSDAMKRSASDWRFGTEAEASATLAGFGGQVKLFHFQSEEERVGAWVLYAALGLGLGMKVKATEDGVRALLEIVDWASKPKISRGNIDLALSRGQVPHWSLEIAGVRGWFSMADLDWAHGSVFSAGAGLGVGIGALIASAYTADDILFSSGKIGAEFGHLGLSIGDSHNGQWWVVNAWDID